MRFITLAVLIVTVLSKPVLAQVALPGGQLLPPRDSAAAPVPKGSSKITGRVVSGDGTVLRRAEVWLASTESGQQVSRQTLTDEAGRYFFDQLPTGRFMLTATKTGYVTLRYGQRHPFEDGRAVTLSDRQVLEEVDFRLQRAGVIAGRITDELGEPLVGVIAHLQQYRYGDDGQRRIQQAAASPASVATDDRGEFRISGLVPGEYLLQATPVLSIRSRDTVSDSSENQAPTFYPGTLSADEAQPISVGVAEEQVIQFAMVSGRVARVSGTVVDAELRPISGAQVGLATVTGNGGSSGIVAVSGADGAFTVPGVSPGTHTLTVQLRTPGVASQFGKQPINVIGDDLTDVRIVVGPGASLSGRVVFDGTSPRTSTPTSLRVGAREIGAPQLAFMTSAYDPAANGEIDERGAFRLGGVSGRVFISLNPALPWVVRSVSIAGENVTDRPVELSAGSAYSDIRIELTDRPTEIAGRVTDERGRPQEDYVVVVLPAEKLEAAVAARRTRLLRPDTTGRYNARGLRPGSYLAVALEWIEPGRQFAPEVQEKLRSGARPFSVGEGESVTLDLELVSGL